MGTNIERDIRESVQPIAYALNDFDFIKPKTSLLSSSIVQFAL